MNYFDVIICGGGPAGSTCALALANSKLSVAIIDKASFPRDKVCGDAVAAYVPKVLNSIHPKYAEAIHTFSDKMPVNTLRMIAPNGKYLDVTSPESSFISTRVSFDNFLFQLAASESNISSFEGHTITDISIDKTKGITTVIANGIVFNCKLLVGADGAHSITSKKLTNAQPDMDHYSGAVRAYYKNVAGLTPGTFELHFLENILPGYFWIFPLPDNMSNVGLGIPSDVIAAKKLNLRRIMEDIIHKHPEISQRFANAEQTGKIEGYGLPLGSVKKTISGDHFMLCGDAASLIDPATGEGIGQSVISGRYAGWQALKCFEQQDFSAAFMKQYDKQVRSKLQMEARKSRIIQKHFFQHKKLFNACFSFLNKTPALRQMILRQVVKV